MTQRNWKVEKRPNLAKADGGFHWAVVGDGWEIDYLAEDVAHLIAAAPELYEAARNLLDDVRGRYPCEELRCPYMRALDAAVRKTEGKQP